MANLRIGSIEHRNLMCREFRDTFRSYEVPDVRWPELDPDELARVRSMPFWDETLNTERLATKRIRLMVEAEKDPVMREAIAMQEHEEARHAALFESLMQYYEIEVPDPEHYEPRDAQWGFMRMGYGEVFDIFFAFGLFKLAAETHFFPESLTDIFEGLISEEARHIIFFSNWAAYNRRRIPVHLKPWFTVERSAAFAMQALGRLRTATQLARGGAVDKADDFVIQAPSQLCGDDITLRKFVETCLNENERRMAIFDPRLPRPELLPRVMRTILHLVSGVSKPARK